MSKIIGDSLPNIPWQEKPEGFNGAIWRHTENPVIGRNPVEGVARIFNSAVVPYEGAFIGVFRGETINGRPHSPYGSHWEIISAGIIIIMIPTLIIFLTLQKQIYSGLVSGSVKE